MLSQEKPDLILLDLMLPGLSGEEVLSGIKGIPVIVVSAKIDPADKIGVLLGGAADYVTKPFDTGELLARITVQLRKETARVDCEVLCVGSLSMREATREVLVGENAVSLTRTEYAILRLLMKNAGQVVTKSVLLERIFEDTPDCTESSLKQHISNLRRKLRETGGDREYIESVWGIGFKLGE